MKQKLLYTLFILLLYRVGAAIYSMGDGTYEIKDGSLKAQLCQGGGVRMAQTARICKGDYKLFDADITVNGISGDKALLVSTSLSLSEIRGSGFFEMRFGEGTVTLENKKWETGFSYTHKLLSDTFKLRIELYLKDKKQKADPSKLCSAARIYIDGEFAGEYVNDDGTEYAYPSGVNINNENLIVITGLGNTQAEIQLSGYRFSYFSKEN